MRDWTIENVVIYICTTALALGLFAMSSSWHSLWGLALLCWGNFKVRDKT